MAEDGGGHVDDRLRLGVETDREHRHLRVPGAQGAVTASAGVVAAGEIRELDPGRRRHEDVARIRVVEGCPRTGTAVGIVEQGRIGIDAHLVAAGYEQVRVHVGDGTRGLPERAPFDAIAVAAAAPQLPQTLYDQLEPRGRLVVPVGRHGIQRLEVIVRSPEGPAVIKSVPCRFVPLVGEEGF